MEALAGRIAEYCLKEEIIEEQEYDWLVYGLEKRMLSLLAGSVFLAIGIFLSNRWLTIAFLGSFLFLRKRTNGYHTNTIWQCLLLTFLMEVIFLLGILPMLNATLIVILNIAALIILFFFAPINNNSIHFSNEEFVECRVRARIRMLLLLLILVLAWLFGWEYVVKGITIGNTMTAGLLIIGIIKNNKERKEK